MKRGAAFETEKEEDGTLFIRCDKSALKEERKPAPAEARKHPERDSLALDPESISRIVWRVVKLTVALILVIALPFLALIPAFWAGVMRGIDGGEE